MVLSESSPAPVSVVMVSFHTGPVLWRAIDSVLGQSRPVELVLVDNGNPEAIAAQLRGKAAAEPRFKVVGGHGNIGFSRGNNLGVGHTRGDYLLFLNPDCILQPDAVERLQSHAAKLARPFMLGARIVNEDGSNQQGSRRELLTPSTAFVEALHLYWLFPHMRLNKHQDQLPASMSPIPAISGAFMFMPREDFDRIGGFDEGYFIHVEDLDLCFRFRKAGGEIYFAPDIAVTHLGGTSDVRPDFAERHKAKGFIRYFRRNFSGDYPSYFLKCLDFAIWARYLMRRVFFRG